MKIPSWLSWYNKPEYRDIKEYSNAIISGRQLSPIRSKQAIPSRLRLERVLENKTCSPMSLYDFYMYLKYIEYSPENLEFYVWFKHYEDAWQRSAAGDKDVFSEHSLDDSMASLQGKTVDASSNDPELADTMARITDMISNQALCEGDACRPAFHLPQGIKKKSKSFPPADPVAAAAAAATATVTAKASSETATTAVPAPAPSAQPLLLRPATTTATATATATATLNVVDASAGLRAELQAVVRLFLQPGAEKELNIPPAMREQALAALAPTSSSADPANPAQLRPVADHVYLLLRNCSHRNFVRLGISNGTFETLCMATGLGLVLTAAGVLCVLLRAFTPHRGAHSRFDVFVAWPLWWMGLSLVLSGLRGSCFFLLLFTRRQPLPWERFDDSASILSGGGGGSGGGSGGGGGSSGGGGWPARLLRTVSRLMIFDRKMRVKDEHLRRLQYRIVLQSMAFGALFASLGVCVFIFLPVWSQTYHRRAMQ